MDEKILKQKIQESFDEPQAPEELNQRVILRARAVTMGVRAQMQLETAPTEKHVELTSRAIVGQLARVSDLPKDTQPEQLARQLERQPAFVAALRGGNVAQRFKSGEILRRITGSKSSLEPAPPVSVPKKDGPAMG